MIWEPTEEQKKNPQSNKFKFALAVSGSAQEVLSKHAFIKIGTNYNFTTGMSIGLARLSGSSFLSGSEANPRLGSQILMNNLP